MNFSFLLYLHIARAEGCNDCPVMKICCNFGNGTQSCQYHKNCPTARPLAEKPGKQYLKAILLISLIVI